MVINQLFTFSSTIERLRQGPLNDHLDAYAAVLERRRLIGVQSLPLVAARADSLRAEGDHCLDSNRIQNLLEPRNRDRLIVALLIPADHLLAHAQPPGQFGLRDALCNPNWPGGWA